MSYRYNGIDIVVGVGMCAIVFGALLLVFATSGMFLVATSEPIAFEQPSVMTAGMTWLQPALGQAIVERTLLQHQSDRMMASALSEWNQAMLAHRSLQSASGDPFAIIRQRAATVPDDHAARVQAVMGRSIVNFTRRGVRSGILSADLYLSDYNRGMIDVAERMGQRLDSGFASTWQATLGQWIVDASRDYAGRYAMVQERLGTAIMHMNMAQAKTGLEDAWASNQYQLASLLAAVDRTTATADRFTQLAAAEAELTSKPASVVMARTVTWPEIPMGYMIAAALMLMTVFFGGINFSAARREAKALAERNRDAAKWVYRTAA
ncbi:hypothetical protein ACO9S2_13125 [Nitrospira sp. NS4]|uniref:hypothetical protein n=1 Tax=Nitrospira sp. NS4 TaxID=3414498 RepID=UPI003C2CEC08